MPEWTNGTVLKTVVGQLTQGSNPCLSAIIVLDKLERWQSGWMRTPAKGVYRFSVPRVRIPLFPPVKFHLRWTIVNRKKIYIERKRDAYLIIRACSSGVRAVGS